MTANGSGAALINALTSVVPDAAFTKRRSGGKDKEFVTSSEQAHRSPSAAVETDGLSTVMKAV
jgi:hypothetical protein